jgi:DNA-binding NarL/FixJ family response regulator
MRVYWNRIKTLDPVYRLIGRGLSDSEIADELNRTEIKVRECISRMVSFFRFPNRMELARDVVRTNHPRKRYR